MDRLHRTRLLFGDDTVAQLRKSTVMVVGCGAVGSFAIEALARTGIGHLILIDSDSVEESNINRQLFALGSTVGMPKVAVASARIHDINPEIQVDALNLFFDEKTELNFAPDYVIDAIDTVPSKIALYRWCNAHNIPFISSMGAARRTDMQGIQIARLSQTRVCPLASRIRKIVRDEKLPDFDVVYSSAPLAGNTVHGREFGSLITITGTFGLMMANWVINHLAKK